MSARLAPLLASTALLMAAAALADPIAPLHTKAAGALLASR
jgi:hypothetical protein